MFVCYHRDKNWHFPGSAGDVWEPQQWDWVTWQHSRAVDPWPQVTSSDAPVMPLSGLCFSNARAPQKPRVIHLLPYSRQSCTLQSNLDDICSNPGDECDLVLKSLRVKGKKKKEWKQTEKAKVNKEKKKHHIFNLVKLKALVNSCLRL